MRDSARPRLALVAAVAIGVLSCEETPRVDADKVNSVQQQGASPSASRALVATAESIYARAEYDSALTQMRRAHALAQQQRDTFAQARALTWIGLANWRLGRYDEAERWGTEALRLKQRAKLSAELFRSYNALGLLAHDEGRFGAAIALFDSAEGAARAVNDSVSMAKAIGNRGLPHVGIGAFSLARSEFDVLRRVGREAGNRVAEANALSNIGMVEIRAGNPRGAIEPLRGALVLARSAAHSVGEESALGQLGTAYQAMGDPRRALAHLDSALTIARKHGMKREESDDLQLIASLYAESGEHSRALEYLSRAAAISDELGLQDTGGDIARAQARTFFALGDLERSRARAQTARRLHAGAGAVLEQLEDELIIAELSQRMGMLEAAASAGASARALAKSVDAPITRAKLALGLARLSDAAGNPRGVLRALASVPRELAEVGADVAWESHALRARALLALGRNSDAASAGREAIRAIERVRGQFGAGSLRASYTAARADVYADLVIALLRLGRTDEAFEVADAARGRALLDHLATAGRGAGKSRLQNLAQGEQLLRRIDTLVRRLRVADTVPPRRRGVAERSEASFLALELSSARRDYEALLDRAAPAGSGSAVVLGAMPTSVQVRTVLADHEAVVEYLATRDRLIVFVARRDGLTWFEVPVTEEALATRVRQARELLGARAATAQPVLRGLDALLLEPLRTSKALEGVQTIVVVPHASLVYLPFAALIDASGRYLVERHEVLMLPSAASFFALRHQRQVSARTEVTALLTPFPDSLPGTRAEGEAIRGLRAGTRSYSGHRATESALRNELAQPGIVHVATHGVLVFQNPMFSRLELASGMVGADDDGRLEVHELFGLDIQSRLVFLSGCETGAGGAWSTAYARGEDYATLAAAFLYAGARNVIATLWRIEDRGAAVFATAFYKELASGTPLEALARAQRSMILDRTYGAPFYWAAYILAGEGVLTDAQHAQQRRAVTVQ